MKKRDLASFRVNFTNGMRLQTIRLTELNCLGKSQAYLFFSFEESIKHTEDHPTLF